MVSNLKIKDISAEDRLPYTDGTRAVWKWRCPGCDGDTYGTDDEGLTTELIAADPLCVFCRGREDATP